MIKIILIQKGVLGNEYTLVNCMIRNYGEESPESRGKKNPTKHMAPSKNHGEWQPCETWMDNIKVTDNDEHLGF